LALNPKFFILVTVKRATGQWLAAQSTLAWL